MRVDPSRLSVSSQNPQSFNRYSYVENEPVDLVDREGLFLGPLDWSACQDPVLGPLFCGLPIAMELPTPVETEPIGNQPQGVRVPLFGERLSLFVSERSRVLGFLNNRQSDCSKYLLSQLGISGRRVARAVLGQRPFDGTLSTITMLRAGLNSSTGLFSDMTVQDFLNQTGALGAEAFYANPIFGASKLDVYYAPTGIWAPAILHETLHYFLGIDDTTLATRLQIPLEAIRDNGTQVITWKLRDAGCN